MTSEYEARTSSGMAHLFLTILLFAGGIGLFICAGVFDDTPKGEIATHSLAMVIFAPFVLLAATLDVIGLTIIEPNQAGVLVFFGRYNGSIRKNGFWWVNPFNKVIKISLKARNLNGERLKVNDKAGNPIEIAAVIVWHVTNTYDACFEVDDYSDYVSVQSESALRHLATSYPYDSWEDEDIVTLRGNIDEVSVSLERELQERLSKAGVEVMEARLSHLAYASEIAHAMLQRQQATAIIAARQKIVDGAVGMVEMALAKLAQGNIVALDEERKAAMVSNLLVVLCSGSEAQPVINTGTVYH